MNMRAHLLYEACISRFHNLGKETGEAYVNNSLSVRTFGSTTNELIFLMIQNFPQRVQVAGFSKALATLLKNLDPEDTLAFKTQQQLSEKLMDAIRMGRDPPKPLAMLLMHSLQWVGMDSLNMSLETIERLFRSSFPHQRQSLSLMMSAVLANNFDASIKDHCIDWYLRLVKELEIKPAIPVKSRL
jgi:hypothetical protein